MTYQFRGIPAYQSKISYSGFKGNTVILGSFPLTHSQPVLDRISKKIPSPTASSPYLRVGDIHPIWYSTRFTFRPSRKLSLPTLHPILKAKKGLILTKDFADHTCALHDPTVLLISSHSRERNNTLDAQPDKIIHGLETCLVIRLMALRPPTRATFIISSIPSIQT